VQPPYGQPPYHPGYPPPNNSGSKLGLSLGGFFAGVAWIIIVPGLLLTLVNTLAPNDTGAGFLAAGLIALAAPIALLFSGKTRRFGAFMLIGMAVTMIVVAGVCVAFIALLMAGESS
jgi:hypothetical protein